MSTTETGQAFVVYTVEGEPYGYTLADYAKALEVAAYSGMDVGLAVWVWNGDGFSRVEPTVESTGYVVDDYATLTVTLGSESALVRIDGRS